MVNVLFTSSCAQVSTADAATMATLVTFCQHRITNELTEQLYMWVAMVNTSVIPNNF